MKKLGIVSSFNDTCGNAAYADCLSREFSKHCQVVNLSLPSSLMQGDSTQISKAGDKYIDELCKEIEKLDYLNIQFEKGLYGVNNTQVVERIERLVKSASNCIVTLHRIDIEKQTGNFLKRSYFFLSYLFAGRFREAGRFLVNNSQCFYEKLFEIFSKNNVSVMVHTEKEAFLVEQCYNFKKHYTFPITFLTDKQRDAILKSKDAEREWFLERWKIPSGVKIITVFGFVSPYKGHKTLLSALHHLPLNYNFFIWGGQHPYSISRFPDGDPYVKDLCKAVKSDPKLKERVIFLGESSDAQLYAAMAFSDIVVLPYHETGQGMSGVASLALELKANVIFSKNLSFLELKKICPNGFEMFDLGNYMELAFKIEHYKNIYGEAVDNYFEQYNISKNIEFHLDIFKRQESKK